MRIKALLMIAAVTLGIAVAGTGTATAATPSEPFCNVGHEAPAGNGWSVVAPAVIVRTGGIYHACYMKGGDNAYRSVEQLQYTLRTCYGLPVAEAGRYGPATVKAVAQVQRLHGITADGVYGPRTLKAMRWQLHRFVSGVLVKSERCYRPFVSRTFASAPAPGSYSPFCSAELSRHGSGNWWTTLPGTVTRTEQVHFACYLKQGDRSNGVRRLQANLRYCYRASLTVDGYYGPNTRATVQRVQQLHGIRADGVYGPATMKAMYWRFHDNRTGGYSTRCYSPY